MADTQPAAPLSEQTERLRKVADQIMREWSRLPEYISAEDYYQAADTIAAKDAEIARLRGITELDAETMLVLADRKIATEAERDALKAELATQARRIAELERALIDMRTLGIAFLAKTMTPEEMGRHPAMVSARAALSGTTPPAGDALVAPPGYVLTDPPPETITNRYAQGCAGETLKWRLPETASDDRRRFFWLAQTMARYIKQEAAHRAGKEKDNG